MSEELEKLGPVTQGNQVGVRHGAFRTKGAGDTSGFGGLVSPVILPGATSRPFGNEFDVIADRLEAVIAKSGVTADKAIEHYTLDRNQLTIVVRREHLLTVAQALRDDAVLRFEVCLSVSGVHWPEATGRELRVFAQLLSMTHNRRLTLEVVLPDSDPHLPSLTPVWPSTDWHERETYDFFGIIFDGHPALTRIQMPDDWQGHPQRKDYPLGGIPVEYKGAVVPPPSERRSY